MKGIPGFRANRDRDLMQVAAAVVGASAAAQVVQPAAAEGLDVHAALNTYAVPPDAEPGVTEDHDGLSVIGANRRRLIARPQFGGVWIGGCKIERAADVEHLACWLSAQAEEMRRS